MKRQGMMVYPRICITMAAAICAAWMIGCEDNDERKPVTSATDTYEGLSTVKGQVIQFTFDGETPAYLGVPSVGVSGALTAPTGRAGVQVHIPGVHERAVTDDRGLFTITGVPSGLVTVCFDCGGDTAEYPVYVPPDSTVELTNIWIDSGQVTVNGPDTIPPPPAPEPPPPPPLVPADVEGYWVGTEVNTTNSCGGPDPDVNAQWFITPTDITAYGGPEPGTGTYSVVGQTVTTTLVYYHPLFYIDIYTQYTLTASEDGQTLSGTWSREIFSCTYLGTLSLMRSMP